MDVVAPWLKGLQSVLAEFISNLYSGDTEDVLFELRLLADRCAAPPVRIAEPILSSALMAVCLRTVAHLHRSDGNCSCRCTLASWKELTAMAQWERADPRSSLRLWSERFATTFVLEHPPSLALAAAREMRMDPARRWRTDELARLVGTNANRLRVEFRRAFGLGPTDYLQLVRVIAAVSALEDRSRSRR